MQGILTEEQITAIEHTEFVKKEILNTKSLVYRMTVKPGRHGFKIEDSFFVDNYEDPNYNPDEFNPNLGF